MLRRAFDLGITHIDTALFDGAAIPLTAAQRPAELRDRRRGTPANLGTDRIDVVNLRRSGFTPGLLAEGDQIVPLDDQLAELAPLREQGKVVAIGLSHITGKQLRAALPVGITCVQNIYNLLDRSHESLLDTCRDHGIAWVPYFLLGGGYGTLLAVTDAAAVQQTAARLGVTPSQVGLAWQLAHAHAPQTMLIPGTSSTAHLGR